MEIFRQMLTLQSQLILLILVGVSVKKLGIIDEKGRKMLSNLLINLILPCNIISSFQSGVTMSGELMKNCVLSVVFCALLQVSVMAANRFLFRRFPENQRAPLSYGLICSNCSFVGLPVLDTLYGSLGVIYGSIYQIPMRFTMWSTGVSLYTQKKEKGAYLKILIHPCIVAVYIGMVLMVLPIALPGFVNDSISSLSRCTMPMSMVVIGSILADADVKTIFSWPIAYYIFLRLIAVPLLVYAVITPLPVDRLVRAVCVIMAGMPAGSTTSILADQYGRDSLFASQLVFASTVVSMITMPLLCLLL